jgi:hypothetical protein
MVCGLISVCVHAGFSQIIVDSNEIPHEIGTRWVKNLRTNVTVDLGTAGGPQTWSFVTQPMGAENDTIVIVTPSSSPFIDSFTNVNLVYMQQELTDITYQHYGLYADVMISLGIGGTSMGDQWLWQFTPPDSAPLPLHYGDSRHFYYHYMIAQVGVDSVTYSHYGLQECDAYGSVTIPYANYDCLRVCDFDTCVMIMYVSGFPIFYDTTTHIRHNFIAEHYDGVVCVLSQPDETNQYFSDAFSLERMIDFTAGRAEVDRRDVHSIYHYPSPFSNRVSFVYTLTEQCSVIMKIYDATGALVRTLDNMPDYAGSHTVRWNGTHDRGHVLPNGVYLYRIAAGATLHTGKIILVR